MKRIIAIMALVALTVAAASCKKENGPAGEDNENPNPTEISQVFLIDVPLTADPEGFNMITDGGFENFIGDPDWKSRSLWFLPDYISEAETAFDGARTIYADCNSHDFLDVAIQSICVKKGQSYTLSLFYRGAWKGLNTYIGFRSNDDPHDMNTNDAERNDAWDQGYSFAYTTGDETELTAFIGAWCWDNLWLEVDDAKVIPTGTMNDSFIPSKASVTATVAKNVSFSEVSGYEKMVFWEADGKLYGVLHNAVVDGERLANVFFRGSLTADGVKISYVSKSSFGSEFFIPTTGAKVGDNQYVCGYVFGGYEEATAENPNPNWFSEGAEMYASIDGGETWNATEFFRAPESKFIRSSYCTKDDMIYVYGSQAGEFQVRTYVARVPESKLFSVADYEYWDGLEWVKGSENSAASVMYGPTDCMSVVYNKERWTYMMVYRSSTTGQLVYRDSGLPEGEWSGEKLLVADPSGSALSTPIVVNTTANGFKVIAGSALQ